MIVKLFKSNSPTGFILLPLVVIGLRIMPFFRSIEPDTEPAMPFYEMLRNIFGIFPHFAEVFAILLLTIEAIYLNRIIIDTALYQKHSWLPALFFVVLMSAQPHLLLLHPIHPAGLFIMIAMSKITGLHKNEGTRSALFDSGLLIGVASLFYYPSLVLFFWVVASYFTFRTFNWKEFLVIWIGGGIPYLFLFVYFFWTDQIVKFFPFPFNFHFDTSLISHSHSVYLVWIGLLLVLMLVSVARLYGNTAIFNVRQRKTAISFIWFIAASFIVLFLHEPYHMAFAISAVVFSALLAQLFLSMQGWVAETLFAAIAGMIIYLHYFYA